MKFARLGPIGAEIPALFHEGRVFDLRALTRDIDGAFLHSGGMETAMARARRGDLHELRGFRQMRFGAPIARPPAVICVGMNYAAHARESGSEPPSDIVVFHKHPNTVVGPNDDILLPPGSTSTDWEVELAVVIGSRARYLDSPEQALAHVAGFTVANDVSERDFQLRRSLGQWSKGKSFETFNPLGPWLVPTDHVGDGSGLGIRSSVNGDRRQESTTSDLIFTVSEIVYRLSQFLVLEPGDLINTGTPEGVALSGRFPFLAAGDVVEVEIDGLGKQRSTVRSAV